MIRSKPHIVPDDANRHWSGECFAERCEPGEVSSDHQPGIIYFESDREGCPTVAKMYCPHGLGCLLSLDASVLHLSRGTLNGEITETYGRMAIITDGKPWVMPAVTCLCGMAFCVVDGMVLFR